MIHAYLFILNVREENGGHGLHFIQLMSAINKVAGTNITAYHCFPDEAPMQNIHVWRCNGICQHRRPFFGWIQCTSNQAPGPNDLWWFGHERTCTGSFEKVLEPKQKPNSNTSNEMLPKITNCRQTSEVAPPNNVGDNVGRFNEILDVSNTSCSLNVLMYLH